MSSIRNTRTNFGERERESEFIADMVQLKSTTMQFHKPRGRKARIWWYMGNRSKYQAHTNTCIILLLCWTAFAAFTDCPWTVLSEFVDATGVCVWTRWGMNEDMLFFIAFANVLLFIVRVCWFSSPYTATKQNCYHLPDVRVWVKVWYEHYIR